MEKVLHTEYVEIIPADIQPYDFLQGWTLAWTHKNVYNDGVYLLRLFFLEVHPF